MTRLLVGVALVGWMMCLVASPAKAEEAKEVKVAKTWKGSVADEKAIQPPVIVDQKGLEAAWKAWKAEGDVPKVDFAKDLLVTAYTSGSVLNITRVRLDDKGDLQVLAIATRDLRPGFRYMLGQVSREGVKSVNGKELPKEE